MSEHSHTHVHEPGHQHSHAHDHTHTHDHHHDGDTYFTDQLCMVGLSGAFGVICLCLWFWQTAMLKNMLADQFHIYVLLSGIALVVIAFARGVILWRQSRDPKFLHDHSQHHHHHEHDHGHGHEHHVHEGAPPALAITDAPLHVHTTGCGHEHKPGEVCDHDHAAMHAHEHPVGHAHAHADHDAADHDHGWAPWRYVVILIPVILFLLGLPSKSVNLGASAHEQLIGDFTAIIYEALPFIVLGVLIAGLLEEFVPQQAIAKIVPKNHILAIAIGGLLGLVFPMCECGIIVVMKRLLRKGLPLSVCIAYMLAGPVINVVVMTSTYVAFSGYTDIGKNDVLGGPWYVVGLRVGLAYLVACVTAIVVDWQWRHQGNSLLHPSVLRGLRSASVEDNGNGGRPWDERVNNISQTALHDFVDILAFLTLGAILAAGGKFIIKETDAQHFLQGAPAVSILLMMGIAILFCLCSEADAFVAANFPLFWPDSSKLAFLVLGPMLDLKLMLMYTRVFRPRLIYTIVACLVVQVFAYTMVIEYTGVSKYHPPEVRPMIRPPSMDTHCLGVLIGPDPMSQLLHFSMANLPSGRGIALPYKQVYDFADRKDLRDEWNGKTVEVRGQYDPTNPHLFMLTRFKINCCSSDATAVRLPVLARENVTGFKVGDWIRVNGKVEFRDVGRGGHVTVLVVSSAADVQACDPDPNPYIQ